MKDILETEEKQLSERLNNIDIEISNTRNRIESLHDNLRQVEAARQETLGALAIVQKLKKSIKNGE